MNTKVEQIQQRLEAGWHVDDIASDDHFVRIALSRGGRREVVKLDRRDAEEILYGTRNEPLAVQTGVTLLLAAR